MVELPSGYLSDSLLYYKAACGLAPYVYLPRDAGRTAAMEAAKKQMPEAPEFKVGDAVIRKCGCIGYITKEEAADPALICWCVVRSSKDCLYGHSVALRQVLKHYLRPGDKVRCLPWPEKPVRWKNLTGAARTIKVHSLTGRTVTESGYVDAGGRFWSLAHVEKVVP